MSISIGLRNLFAGSSISRMSNEGLIQRYAAKKESHVLGQLYDNCERDLYHFLVSLSDTELAQEIAQHTWLKVIEKSHLYRDHGSFKSWLFTIGRRCLIDEFRKLGRFQELFEERLAPVGDNIVNNVTATHNSIDYATASASTIMPTHNETYHNAGSLNAVESISASEAASSLINQFNIALRQLPFTQKEAFCLQQEGFALHEIAQLTASETETVKSRIRYAKQALKKHLEKYRD